MKQFYRPKERSVPNANWKFAWLLIAAVVSAAATPSAWAQSRAREVSSDRNPSGAGLGSRVFADMSDEVVQKMLASQAFQRILAEGERPRLVVGNTPNRTNDETIAVGDIGRRISEVVIESGLVRWFEFGTNDFDLVVSPLLSGVVSGEGKRMEYRLTLSLTLSDAQGEVVGRWLADRTYER